MSGLTLWGADQLSRMFFGRTAEPPVEFYLALVRQTEPNAFSDASELDEPGEGVNYGRMLLKNDSTIWDTDGYYLTTNVVGLTYPIATGDWGRIQYWALCNSLTEGFIYFTGRFPQSEIVYTNDQAYLPPGSIQFSANVFTRSAF